MVTTVTRQELQNALDRSRSVILGSMLTRNDLQSVINQVRSGLLQDTHVLHAENQATIRQSISARAQIMQRLSSIEARLGGIEQNLRSLTTQHSKTSDSLNRMQPTEKNGGYMFQRV